ncbi:acyltransferase domain-containing protein [Amycolatopsis japonica]|uniref:acyltransferase domain-containing protein n=1 Tax=Amycolatopsis japonica TaxID=208439 RepID=UPI00332CB02A
MEIAIVGLSAFVPGSLGAAGYWRATRRRSELVTAVLPATDEAQLLALYVIDGLLRDLEVGLAFSDRERVKVILDSEGIAQFAPLVVRTQRPIWEKVLRESGIADDLSAEICERIAVHHASWPEVKFPGMLSNVVAGRVASEFAARGRFSAIDAACASPVAALVYAVGALEQGHADLVITGGPDYPVLPGSSVDQADGFVSGQPPALLALKRLTDAERAGNRIYAVIKGLGFSSDGRADPRSAPLAGRQASAMRSAYDEAGYGPETVELVQTQGADTSDSDLVEFDALCSVFSSTGRQDGQWSVLGSVEPQLGGGTVGGLVETALALHHRTLPAVGRAQVPELEASPFYVNTRPRPWIRGSAHPRRASVSNSGTGFHLALEEYQPVDALAPREVELIPISGSSVGELRARVRDLREGAGELATIAWRAQQVFDPFAACRLAVVASDVELLWHDLDAGLERAAVEPSWIFSSPAGLHYQGTPPLAGDIAFLFPGLGSQYLGMGADLAMRFPAARALWDQAADVPWEAETDRGDEGSTTSCAAGPALHSIVFPHRVLDGDAQVELEGRLTSPEWAQPALAVNGMAMVRLLSALGIEPQHVAGHGFGELVALQVAGVLEPGGLLQLARRYGLALRYNEAVTMECGLTTVPGQQDRSTGAYDEITAAGCHPPLTGAETERLQAFLAKLSVSDPRVPVYSNVDTELYPAGDPDEVRARLARHLRSPADFGAMINDMYRQGVRIFIEVGAGSELTGLVERILADRPCTVVNLDRKGSDGVAAFFSGLAVLAVNGVPIAYDALWNDQ